MSERPSGPPASTLVVSYLALRKAVGCVGIALPFVLSIGDRVIFGEGIRTSISSYYHTGMGDVFVGALWAIGVFMLSYKGYERRDAIAGDLACIFAVGVALFPTAPEPPAAGAAKIVGAIHWTCAALFLGTLAYFSLFLFTKTGATTTPTRRKTQRNRVYRGCGGTMVACLVLILAYKLLPAGAREALAGNEPVFWLESTAVLAFGISWLVKGEALLKDELPSRDATRP